MAKLTNIEREFNRLQRLTTAAKMATEADTALAGVQWLKLNGWKVHRVKADKYKGGGNNKAHEAEDPGTPDYVCHRRRRPVGNWRLFYWEAKRPVGGKVRDSQKTWKESNPEEIVCYAKTPEELQAWCFATYPDIEWTARIQ